MIFKASDHICLICQDTIELSLTIIQRGAFTIMNNEEFLSEDKKKHRSSFIDRMNDFQFEIIRAPQKKYDEFTNNLDHDD
jgi:hypothetical protein